MYSIDHARSLQDRKWHLWGSGWVGSECEGLGHHCALLQTLQTLSRKSSPCFLPTGWEIEHRSCRHRSMRRDVGWLVGNTEETLDSAVLAWSSLNMSITYSWLMVLLSLIMSLPIFGLLHLSIFWLTGVDVSNYNTELIYFSLQVYQFSICIMILCC